MRHANGKACHREGNSSHLDEEACDQGDRFRIHRVRHTVALGQGLREQTPHRCQAWHRPASVTVFRTCAREALPRAYLSISFLDFTRLARSRLVLSVDAQVGDGHVLFEASGDFRCGGDRNLEEFDRPHGGRVSEGLGEAHPAQRRQIPSLRYNTNCMNPQDKRHSNDQNGRTDS